MLSHDTRLRCDLVDLYYTLYGTKRPVCLPIPELAGVLNYPKEGKKTPHIPKQLPPETKQSPKENQAIIIDDNLECMNVEIVANNDKIKVL